MKQHITKEQWNELSDMGQLILCDKGYCFIEEVKAKKFTIRIHYPTIGQMIEFLGDDWDRQAMEQSDGMDNEALLPKNICNSCWEAVKYKLR